jgi:hypothetical protein
MAAFNHRDPAGGVVGSKLIFNQYILLLSYSALELALRGRRQYPDCFPAIRDIDRSGNFAQ